ncbi:restriction endonuclease subunit S [Flavobacterium sp.]|uniref:restriction endonuclease subunit S n=1 Tax=Flavobacterium sp. TaxID=239 RepID=UPI0039E3288D
MRFPEFSDEWKTKKLGEIATFSKGKGISKSDVEEPGITECIRYGELYTHYGAIIDEVKSKTNVDISDLVLSESNDVIIPASGETTIDIATASCVLKSGIALGSDLNIIKTENNGVFLSYYLNSKKKMEIANLAQGISVVHLYSSQLASLSLSLPKFGEQNKISSFLSLLDKRIQTQNKIIKELSVVKITLAKNIFSQRLRFKDQNNNQFSNWEKKKLGELGEIINGLTYSPKDINSKGILVLRSSNIQNRSLAFNDNVYVNTKKYNPVKENDILICVRNGSKNLIGKNALICKDNEGLAFGAFMSVYRSPYNKFIFQWFDTDEYREIVNRNLGATINSINGSDLKKILIHFPSLHEQTKIADFLEAVGSKIEIEIQLLRELEKQKKFLLHNMFI